MVEQVNTSAISTTADTLNTQNMHSEVPLDTEYSFTLKDHEEEVKVKFKFARHMILLH